MLGGRATHYGLGERSGQPIRVEKHRCVAHHHDARSTITAGAVRPVGAATPATTRVRTGVTSGSPGQTIDCTATAALAVVEANTASRGVNGPAASSADTAISAGGTVTGSTTATAPEKIATQNRNQQAGSTVSRIAAARPARTTAAARIPVTCTPRSGKTLPRSTGGRLSAGAGGIARPTSTGTSDRCVHHSTAEIIPMTATTTPTT